MRGLLRVCSAVEGRLLSESGPELSFESVAVVAVVSGAVSWGLAPFLSTLLLFSSRTDGVVRTDA